MEGFFMFLLVVLMMTLLVISFTLKGLIIVPQQSVVVIETLGRYKELLSSGLHFILPFFEAPRQFIQLKKDGKGGKNNEKWMYSPYIDLRETVLEYPLKGMITKDGSVININISVYFQITDAKRAVYSVCNLYEALENLFKKTAQNIINELCLDEILTAKPKLLEIMNEQAFKWGVKVNNIILSDLSLSGY